MTENKEKVSRKHVPSGKVFGVLGALALAIVIVNAETASEYMIRGLKLCAETVIPSLFPFMVISDIITCSGAGALLAGALERPMKRLFGISGAGAEAFLLGALCGFPIGARAAVSLLDSGAISRSECESLLTFTNNPSAAFIMSAVGVSLFTSKSFGIALYAIVVFSSLTTGLLFCRLLGKKGGEVQAPRALGERRAVFGASELTGAISSSAFGVLKVCSFVLFFSVMLGILGEGLQRLGIAKAARAVIFCVFEMTGGMAEAAALKDTFAALVTAAFAAGWSGISVHFQIISICEGRGLSFKPYFAAKLIQGALCASVTAIVLRFAPSAFGVAQRSGEAIRLIPNMPSVMSVALIVVFLLGLAVGIAKKANVW